MLKFNRVVCALAVCLCVGAAFGAAVRITDFTITEPDLNADAMAILAYATGHDITNVQIMVSDFTPGATYDVHLVCELFTDKSPGTLVTNSEGHGNAHLQTQDDLSMCSVEILINLAGGGLKLRASG